MKFRPSLLVLIAIIVASAHAQDSLHVQQLAQISRAGQTLALSVAMRDTLAFTACGGQTDFWGRFRIHSISDPYHPVTLATIYYWDAHDIALMGNYALVSQSWQGAYLHIIDISNPRAPIEVGNYPVASSQAAAVGNTVYAGTPSGLIILNLTDPAAPVELGTWSGPHAECIAVFGSYVYIGTHSNGVRVVDVNDPAAPVEVGSWMAPGYCSGVTTSGHYLYVACYDAGVHVLDISDPAAPAEVGDYNLPGGEEFRVAVAGDFAYVAGGISGLRVVDISNPTAPVEVGYHAGIGRAVDVAVQGCVALVANYSSFGLYDVSYFACSPPQPPDKVVLMYLPEAERAQLHWAPVVTNLINHPVQVNRYVIYRKANFDSTQWDSIGAASDTMFVDSTVTEWRGYYEVKAVVE